MSDEFNTKCSIEQNEELGRYVKSQETINAGETIIWEKPAIILSDSLNERCSNCFKHAATYCQKCSIAPLCGECSMHNTYDCSLLSGMSNVDTVSLKDYPRSYDLLKLLLLNENPETELTFKEILKLESHLDKRRNTIVWNDYNKDVVQPILKYGIKDYLKLDCRINEDFLQHLCGILDVNTYEIRAPDSGTMRALYLKASLLAHACNANCNVSIDHEYRIKIYANRSITANHSITNCYTNVLLGTNERRRILLESKYFYCKCLRCLDPTELGSHMSTLICSFCTCKHEEGFIVCNHTKNDSWICQNCSNSLPEMQIINMLEKIKAEIQFAALDVMKCEALLDKLATILHKNHYLMIDIKQHIAGLLHSYITDSLSNPSRFILERLVQICQELVMVLHIIQPGISRLKAIALYELGVASIKLYRERFNQREISYNEFTYLLKQCEAMFREAVRMLSFEPPETPEGQMARNALIKLKDLQDSINVLNANENTA